MEKSVEGRVKWRAAGVNVNGVSIVGELPPCGTVVRITWEEPEPEVTCCEAGRRAIYRGDGEWRAEIWMSDVRHWEDYVVVACPFCGSALPGCEEKL